MKDGPLYLTVPNMIRLLSGRIACGGICSPFVCPKYDDLIIMNGLNCRWLVLPARASIGIDVSPLDGTTACKGEKIPASAAIYANSLQPTGSVERLVHPR